MNKTLKTNLPLSGILANRRSALYPWFEEHGFGLVHPEDLERFKALLPYGKVFEIGESLGGYVCLLYGADTFRVKPGLLTEVPPTKYRIGDKVEVGGKEGVGEIIDVLWHHGKAMPFFQIVFDGKKIRKRYWETDFVSVD